MQTQLLSLSSVAQVQREGDLFICSASYEERCLSIPRELDASVLSRAIVCENMNHQEQHRGHGQQLMTLFGEKAVLAGLDTRDPIRTGDSLVEAIGSSAGNEHARIVIDCTTFTHEALLIIIRFLHLRRRWQNVIMLYAPAAEYSVNEKGEAKWLSKGVGEIRSVLGYPGRILPSRHFHLIVLMGLEGQRTLELIGRFEPSEISIGFGSAKYGRGVVPRALSDGVYEKVLAIHGSARTFAFDPYDPQKVKAQLARQVKRVRDFNVVIAPMNTKLSTIGAGLFASEIDEVQLCYAQALVYNYLGYSRPGGEAFVVEL